MDTGILIRLGAGGLIALLGLALASRTSIDIRLTQEHFGIVLILGGVFFAYRAIQAHFDARDHDRHHD